MQLSFWLKFVTSCVLLSALGSTVFAQTRERRRREPAAIPMDATIQWTVFVSAYEDTPARRTNVATEPGTIGVPIAGWQCRYSAPNRAQLDGTNWSEMRTLECTHGNAVVSTTGFCQIAGASWGARAAMLSLGSTAADSRATVTLDCAMH